MNPDFKKRIFKKYRKDSWWSKLLLQMQKNEIHGAEAAKLFFVFKKEFTPNGFWSLFSFCIFWIVYHNSIWNVEKFVSNNFNFFTIIQFENVEKYVQNNFELFINDFDLLYHVKKMTEIQRLCISPKMFPEIFKITHNGGHPGFKRCFEIISKIWYVKNLIKNLEKYIRYCSECLILQIRKHKFMNHYNLFQHFQYFIMSFRSILSWFYQKPQKNTIPY